MNSENMSNHSSTKNFGKLQCKLRPAEVMTFFFGLHLLSGRKMVICGRDDLSFLVFTCCSPENWTSADMMTLEEHVLLLRSEDMVLLVLLPNFCCHLASNALYYFRRYHSLASNPVATRSCVPWNLPQLLWKENDVIRAQLMSSKKIGKVIAVALNAHYLAAKYILPILRKLFFGIPLAKIFKKNRFAI